MRAWLLVLRGPWCPCLVFAAFKLMLSPTATLLREATVHMERSALKVHCHSYTHPACRKLTSSSVVALGPGPWETLQAYTLQASQMNKQTEILPNADA